MHLACEQHWINRNAEIVTDRIVDDFHYTRQRIHFDFGDMGTVWIGRIRRGEIAKPAGHIGCCTGQFSNVSKRHLLIGAGNAHRTIDDFKIGDIGFKFIGSQFFELLRKILGSNKGRYAADRDRTRTTCTMARCNACGIALHDLDLIKRQIEMLGSKLSIGRCMALTVRLRTGIDRD